MLGVLVPLSWITIDVRGVSFSLAHLLVFGFFLFYLTLDVLFAIVFLVFGFGLTVIASMIAGLSLGTSATVAAVLFFGGYVAQFIGHAIEKSMPVLVKHPVQANLAAPFFTVVEMFKLLGLRDELFNEVQRQIALRRHSAAE
jgi:uncharacterized membrane protein YGL010W